MTKIDARELAQLPRAVGVLKSVALGRAREDQFEMRAGHVGEGADHEARAGQHAGIDGVAHRAHLAGQEAPRTLQAEVAQRGEAHLEAELRMEKGVHLLQMRRDFPLRHAIILECAVVEHAEMDVQIHHSRHQRAVAGINHLDAVRNWRPCPCRRSI